MTDIASAKLLSKQYLSQRHFNPHCSIQRLCPLWSHRARSKIAEYLGCFTIWSRQRITVQVTTASCSNPLQRNGWNGFLQKLLQIYWRLFKSSTAPNQSIAISSSLSIQDISTKYRLTYPCNASVIFCDNGILYLLLLMPHLPANILL